MITSERNGAPVKSDESGASLDSEIDGLAALAEQADADAEEAEAHAVAVRARARAIHARQRALEVQWADDSDDSVEQPDTQPRRPRFRLPVRASWPLARRLAAVVIAVAALAASGAILWHQHQAGVERQRGEAFSTAAQQGVIALTSLDFAKASEDVQRIIDRSTGDFKSDFQKRSQDFIKMVADSQVVTRGNVFATAVESMNADSAVILVAATSEVVNSSVQHDKPRAWRLEVTVMRDGSDIKMSKVEFVQ